VELPAIPAGVGPDGKVVVFTSATILYHFSTILADFLKEKKKKWKGTKLLQNPN
jgi:hypothetical protein